MFPLSQCLATWFYSGYSPKMPGTVGSFAALPFIWACLEAGALPALGLFTMLSLLIGLWASKIYMIHRPESKDPSEIVIDEVAGQALTILLMIWAVPEWPLWLHFGLGFALFRLFDITKPGPIIWCDRHMPGFWGVMFDDIAAGICAALTAIIGASLYYGVF